MLVTMAEEMQFESTELTVYSSGLFVDCYTTTKHIALQYITC